MFFNSQKIQKFDIISIKERTPKMATTKVEKIALKILEILPSTKKDALSVSKIIKELNNEFEIATACVFSIIRRIFLRRILLWIKL